jgi:hypothetical protein
MSETLLLIIVVGIISMIIDFFAVIFKSRHNIFLYYCLGIIIFLGLHFNLVIKLIFLGIIISILFFINKQIRGKIIIWRSFFTVFIILLLLLGNLYINQSIRLDVIVDPSSYNLFTGYSHTNNLTKLLYLIYIITIIVGAKLLGEVIALSYHFRKSGDKEQFLINNILSKKVHPKKIHEIEKLVYEKYYSYRKEYTIPDSINKINDELDDIIYEYDIKIKKLPYITSILLIYISAFILYLLLSPDRSINPTVLFITFILSTFYGLIILYNFKHNK